ncbi:MAG: hypothetical protein K2L33_01330 [Muribaculaceae bacterium]|nr:hypothetical protein [Muribaculaceae bacterium]
MKIYLPSIILSAAIAVAACSCAKDKVPESAESAMAQGRADAKALCAASYTTDRDLHAALLAVKSREWEIRQLGDSIAASAYIDAFKEQLTLTDKTLASKIF